MIVKHDVSGLKNETVESLGALNVTTDDLKENIKKLNSNLEELIETIKNEGGDIK